MEPKHKLEGKEKTSYYWKYGVTQTQLKTFVVTCETQTTGRGLGRGGRPVVGDRGPPSLSHTGKRERKADFAVLSLNIIAPSAA